MALLALESRSLAGLYIFASTTAHYAMSPLIFTAKEYGIKVRQQCLPIDMRQLHPPGDSKTSIIIIIIIIIIITITSTTTIVIVIPMC